ncbi:MAG: type I phosphomannose isomerase catalytic subunit [Bacteroidota bacterium]
MKNSNTDLYPIKFYPIYKQKIWGGNKLASNLGRPGAPKGNCGESWEVSTVPQNVSIIKGGRLGGLPLDKVIKSYQADLLGKKVYAEYGNTFPLLIKYIDAVDNLSIQVHPNDELALKRHSSLGKTEMWYIMEAEEGALIINGFNQKLRKDDYLTMLSNLGSIFKREEVKRGDAVFIPAGTVHAIGKGILLAEIQQCSDVTYRIYDYERAGDNGNKRELHLEDAFDAIDYRNENSYIKRYQKHSIPKLVNCAYFTTNHVETEAEMLRDYSQLDSFVIYMIMEGAALIKTESGETNMTRGDVCLIPACFDYSIIKPLTKSRFLEVHC